MMQIKYKNPKQVNAVLIALDAEIENALGGRPVDWETFPELAAMLQAYYVTRVQYEGDLKND
jgi:hypothetical protein